LGRFNVRTLLFKNNVHSTEKIEIPGLDEPRTINLTVRKGLKWSDIPVGDPVELRETGDETLRHRHVGSADDDDRMVTATIFDVKVMSFKSLQSYPQMLKLEHDPDCRTWSGLYKVMRQVYDGFLADEVVTLVFYELD
jgi:hypothetical protein